MAGEDDLFGAQTLGRSREYDAEGSLRSGTGQGACSCRGCPLSVRRGICSVRGLPPPWAWRRSRSLCSGCTGRVQPQGEALALAGMSAAAGYGEYMLAVTSSHFGERGEGVPFPAGVCEPAPAVCPLDCHRKRRVCRPGAGAEEMRNGPCPERVQEDSGLPRKGENGTKRA